MEVNRVHQRSPVGVSTGEKGIVVVCDDGSVWIPKGTGNLGASSFAWEEIAPIPGTARAASYLTATQAQPAAGIGTKTPTVVVR
jgi:hypothetical protein